METSISLCYEEIYRPCAEFYILACLTKEQSENVQGAGHGDALHRTAAESKSNQYYHETSEPINGFAYNAPADKYGEAEVLDPDHK